MRGAAIVTGGAGGIGRAVIARLNREGYVAASWDLSLDSPDAALSLTVDVTDAAALDRAAAETAAKLGHITALVVTAGILGPTARDLGRDGRACAG